MRDLFERVVRAAVAAFAGSLAGIANALAAGDLSTARLLASGALGAAAGAAFELLAGAFALRQGVKGSASFDATNTGTVGTYHQ